MRMNTKHLSTANPKYNVSNFFPTDQSDISSAFA